MRARQAVSVGGDDGASIQAFLIVIGQSLNPIELWDAPGISRKNDSGRGPLNCLASPGGLNGSNWPGSTRVGKAAVTGAWTAG
jgi:hypothetical protein